MPKITFLMKVFNGEAFVEKSIKSVLNQTEKDFVLFIRNNGSKDRSDIICKKYAKRDSRIIYLENKTVSVTDDGYLYSDRKFWPAFESEYVSIVDHDDMLAPDFAEKMYKRAKSTRSQITICGNSFFRYGDDKHLGNRLPPDLEIEMPGSFGRFFPELYGCLRTIWGKLYETKWYEQHYHILADAPEDLKLCTDTYYILTYLKHCQKLSTVPLPLYHYCLRPGSGFNSSSVHSGRIHDADILYRSGRELLNHYHALTPQNDQFLYSVHWGHMCDTMDVLCNAGKMRTEDKLDYVQNILNNELLQIYRKKSFQTVWAGVLKCLARLIPDIQKAEPGLWRYYIVRLYDVYKSDAGNNVLLFTELLSALCDRNNRFHFGLEFIKDIDWVNLSAGQENFSLLSDTGKTSYLENLNELHKILSAKNPQSNQDEYLIMEDALAGKMEVGDIEGACSILGQLNQNYPESEYAFYYRIYLASMTEELRFARKQIYEALTFWPDSMELNEIANYINKDYINKDHIN